MPFMARSNIHLDILMGRDESLDVHDIFEGNSVNLSIPAASALMHLIRTQ